MFKYKQTTFMQSVLEAELQDFKDYNVPEALNTTSKDDFFKGEVLFKIPINKAFMSELVYETRNTIQRSMVNTDLQTNFHDARHDDGLFDAVTDQIINIDANKPLKECLDIILDYKNALKENFYGAVLRTPNNRMTINPFHILTTLSVMNDEEYQTKLYNIIIYAYTDRQALNAFTSNHVADVDLMNKNIDALMNAYVARIPTITRYTKSDRETYSDTTININKQTKKFPDEDEVYNHYIVATQLLTKGILAPFYGATLLKANGTTDGLRLTPFGVCNIWSDSERPIPDPNPRFNSICTGRQDKKTLKGMRTLSHANLASPFGGGFIQNGALAYADIMIERAITLYESAELITKDKNIPLGINIETVEQAPKPLYSDLELASTSLRAYYSLCRVASDLPNTASAGRERYEAMLEYQRTQAEALYQETDEELEHDETDLDPIEEQEHDEIIAIQNEIVAAIVDETVATIVDETVAIQDEIVAAIVDQAGE